MQQTRHDRFLIHLKIGQNDSHTQGMNNIGLS